MVQHYTAIANRYTGIGICRESKFKTLNEVAPKFANKLKARAKLAIECGPSYLDVALNSMQSVC